MAIELKIDAATLEQHRIAEIATATIASVLPRTVGRNSFRCSHGNGRRHEVIVVTTDGGKVGWGPPLGAIGDAARFVGRTVADLIDPRRGGVDEALPRAPVLGLSPNHRRRLIGIPLTPPPRRRRRRSVIIRPPPPPQP